MASRDYILRIIEQLGRFLIALRRLILEGKAGTGDVEQQLRWVGQQAGVDLELARVATVETLLMLAAPTGEIEPARCWLYAETLYLDALNADLSGEPDRAFASYHKARALFSLVAPKGAFLVGFPEGAERMREIDRRLAELETDGGDDGGGARHSRRVRGRRSVAARRGSGA